ncbi:MAG: YceI family protein [bacterium]
METITTQKWALDTAHSEVQFKVKHLVISTVTGTFKVFGGNLESNGEDFEGAKVDFSVDIQSIETNNADRNTHLKSDDFFSAEKYPSMNFVSTSFKKISGSDYELNGDLTIRDVTKSITLKAEFGGIIVDPWGQTKAGFEVEGKINRKDYGLVWSAVTESGGLVVSDEVKLHINVEFSKQA